MSFVPAEQLPRKIQLAEFTLNEMMRLAASAEGGLDLRALLQIKAGLLVEMAFLFDEPETALDQALFSLADLLRLDTVLKVPPQDMHPMPYEFDQYIEQGRDIARDSFVEWLEDPYEYLDVTLFMIHHALVGLEESDVPRLESYGVLFDFAHKALVLETAAQDLCDIVIEHKMGGQGWSLADSISGLSGTAGQKLAEWLMRRGPKDNDHYVRDFLSLFDPIVHVMTREAVRYGIPVGSDWRFGLAANDLPPNAPIELVMGIEPFCDRFFDVAGITDRLFQAVACAKAAGRMLAVAAGGENPEMAPVIAKPLAMAAMTETYRMLYPFTASR